MTLTEKVEKFLQVDKQFCANDGKPLKFPYLKLSMWKQHPLGSWGWFKQVMAGDNQVMRFHDNHCFREFASKGRLVELEGTDPEL